MWPRQRRAILYTKLIEKKTISLTQVIVSIIWKNDPAQAVITLMIIGLIYRFRKEKRPNFVTLTQRTQLWYIQSSYLILNYIHLLHHLWVLNSNCLYRFTPNNLVPSNVQYQSQEILEQWFPNVASPIGYERIPQYNGLNIDFRTPWNQSSEDDILQTSPSSQTCCRGPSFVNSESSGTPMWVLRWYPIIFSHNSWFSWIF